MFAGSKMRFTSRNSVEQRAGLPADERGAAQAAGVFAADAAAQGENLLVQFFGQTPHPLHVVRPAKLEKRLNVKLPLAGVAIERGGYLVALQHVLHSHQEIGKHAGRNRHVFDDRQRAVRARRSIQHRLHLVDQTPEQLRLVFLERLPRAEGHPLLLP